MYKIALGLAVLGLSTTAGLVQAQTTFSALDTDRSGELSFVELQLAWPNLNQAQFATADADASGGLSNAEMSSLQATPAPAAAPARQSSGFSDTPDSLAD